MTILELKDKNILFITHSYNNFQKEMIESVSNNFKKCDAMVRSNPIAELSNYLSIPFLNRYKLSSKIDLTNLPPNISVSSTPIYYTPIESQYRKLGEKHFKTIDKKIQNEAIDFDLVHSHFTWSAGCVGAKLKEKYDVPFVVTGHGYDIYKLPFKDYDWKKRIEYVLNSADHIITVSKSNLECINRLDVSTPVTVIPNGYNSNKFHPRDQIDCRNQLDIPHDRYIILTVGNLEEVKGHKYLIEAMQEIVDFRENVLCYIVGSGPLENKLKKQINEAGLNNHVKLMGSKPHDEIPIWMNACDLFVLPSLNEGNPTVMFECLGCGKQFIGTKVGGIPEVITSDDYGFLVEPGDSEDLAEKVKIALDNTWYENKIVEYADQYQWEATAKQILKVYCSVL